MRIATGMSRTVESTPVAENSMRLEIRFTLEAAGTPRLLRDAACKRQPFVDLGYDGGVTVQIEMQKLPEKDSDQPKMINELP